MAPSILMSILMSVLMLVLMLVLVLVQILSNQSPHCLFEAWFIAYLILFVWLYPLQLVTPSLSPPSLAHVWTVVASAACRYGMVWYGMIGTFLSLVKVRN